MSFFETFVLEATSYSNDWSLNCTRMGNLIFLELYIETEVDSESEHLQLSVNRPDILPKQPYSKLVLGSVRDHSNTNEREVQIKCIVDPLGIHLIFERDNFEHISVGKELLVWSI